MKLSDRTSLLSVVSHSLSAYITTLEPAPLQRLSARIASEVSLWLCDLFKFTNGAAYCHDDTREGKTFIYLSLSYRKECMYVVGKFRQKSQATAGRNFTKPHSSHHPHPCTGSTV